MDRDILRIALIGTGIFLILVLYIWDRLRKRKDQNDDFDHADFGRESPVSDDSDQANDPLFDEPVRRHRLASGDEVIIRGARKQDRHDSPPQELNFDREQENIASEYNSDAGDTRVESSLEETQGQAWQVPDLIQLAVVTNSSVPFEGTVMASVFTDLQLRYGDMGIYHYYSSHTGELMFSIATMVEPGTFPDGDMDGFSVPGLMLFMQPKQLSDSLAALDDMIRTGKELAERLDGVLWDENRQTFTDTTIDRLEDSLTPPAKVS